METSEVESLFTVDGLVFCEPCEEIKIEPEFMEPDKDDVQYSCRSLVKVQEKHMRVPTGKKPFKCNVCGKSSAQLSSSSHDKRIHMGEKPFECSECNKILEKESLIDTSKCIFCLRSLTECEAEDSVVKKPTSYGLNAIFKLSKKKGDEVYELLKPLKEEILSRIIKVSYHNSCRSSYMKYINRDSNSQSSEFDFSRCCFICGQRPTWRKPLIPISNRKGTNTRQKVISAAVARQDDTVHQRMLSHSDLFAHGAKYHHSCYSSYLSARNIASAQNKSKASCGTSCYDKAIELVVENILSNNRTVTTLSQVKFDYIQELQKMDVETSDHFYPSGQLKKKIKSKVGDKIMFISRPGMSDLVCASSVTVGDVLENIMFPIVTNF